MLHRCLPVTSYSFKEYEQEEQCTSVSIFSISLLLYHVVKYTVRTELHAAVRTKLHLLNCVQLKGYFKKQWQKKEGYTHKCVAGICVRDLVTDTMTPQTM